MLVAGLVELSSQDSNLDRSRQIWCHVTDENQVPRIGWIIGARMTMILNAHVTNAFVSWLEQMWALNGVARPPLTCRCCKNVL